MLKGLFTSCDIWLVSIYFGWIVMDATCGTGNDHSFRNTWFHSLWGVPDFTHSLDMHYRMCQSTGYYMYIYWLMTGLFACISLTALSPTYFITVNILFNLLDCSYICNYSRKQWPIHKYCVQGFVVDLYFPCVCFLCRDRQRQTQRERPRRNLVISILLYDWYWLWLIYPREITMIYYFTSCTYI